VKKDVLEYKMACLTQNTHSTCITYLSVAEMTKSFLRNSGNK
jgi:hypothetical protein